jgi:hypothetical protein
MDQNSQPVASQELVTAADHDAGFKEIEVVFRSGRRETVKLTAPNYRAAQKLALELARTKDAASVVSACFPRENDAARNTFLNRLTPNSAALIEAVSFTLTFGSDFQKKMEALGNQLMAAINHQPASTASAPNLPSSPPDLTPPKPGNSACPNCGCIIGSPGNDKSPTTCGGSSSPPAPA